MELLRAASPSAENVGERDIFGQLHGGVEPGAREAGPFAQPHHARSAFGLAVAKGHGESTSEVSGGRRGDGCGCHYTTLRRSHGRGVR